MVKIPRSARNATNQHHIKRHEALRGKFENDNMMPKKYGFDEHIEDYKKQGGDVGNYKDFKEFALQNTGRKTQAAKDMQMKKEEMLRLNRHNTQQRQRMLEESRKLNTKPSSNPIEMSAAEEAQMFRELNQPQNERSVTRQERRQAEKAKARTQRSEAPPKGVDQSYYENVYREGNSRPEKRLAKQLASKHMGLQNHVDTFQKAVKSGKLKDEEEIRSELRGIGKRLNHKGEDMDDWVDKMSSSKSFDGLQKEVKDHRFEANLHDKMIANKGYQAGVGALGTVWLVNNMAAGKGQQSNSQLYGQQQSYY